ncbi:MAG: DUF3050 domain-containing protein [bacterium]
MNLNLLNQACQPLRQKLLDHSIYGVLGDLPAMQLFMEMHVYAVWDFMSLLKALQFNLACVSCPWLPAPDPIAARMINQIVLGEESDIDTQGNPASHFELYLQAMQQIGADTNTINQFIDHLKSGQPWPAAASLAGVPQPAQAFMRQTFDIIETGHLVAIASAFTLGRENLVPGLFRGIVEGLENKGFAHADRFLYYLDRHISLDEDEHGPIAFEMLARLCGNQPENWQIAENAAMESLATRLHFWNEIQKHINTKCNSTKLSPASVH